MSDKRNLCEKIGLIVGLAGVAVQLAVGHLSESNLKSLADDMADYGSEIVEIQNKRDENEKVESVKNYARKHNYY